MHPARHGIFPTIESRLLAFFCNRKVAGIRENLKNGYDVAAMSVISWIRDLFGNQEAREHECVNKWLINLSPREQEIVVTLGACGQDDKVTRIRHRRELAVKLGITYTDLMSEVQRIRAKLQHCVGKCMSE